jgi:hypothetical protein
MGLPQRRSVSDAGREGLPNDPSIEMTVRAIVVGRRRSFFETWEPPPQQYQREPVHAETPQKMFERRDIHPLNPLDRDSRHRGLLKAEIL